MNIPAASFALACCLAAVAAQETPPTPAPAPAPAPATAQADGFTEGFGRAATYRAALSGALEDAVAKAKGVGVARGAGVRSRLSVVAKGAGDAAADADAVEDRDWVQLQIAGFVQAYEVVKKSKQDDGNWEVTVRAKVAGAAVPGEALFVVELVDDDLRSWQLERFEEGAAAGPFAKVEGTYEAPTIRDNLRATGVVRFAAKAPASERDPASRQLVPSHRVTVRWQPMQFRSLVERPNAARPTSGPRPQYLTAASVRVQVQVVDVVQNVDLLDRPLTIALDVAPSTPVERLDALAVQLGDRAKAAVAETVFFALQPPVVLRKWVGDGGAWLVEAAMSRRVAQGYEQFVVGSAGSLGSPDWRQLGTAALVGGTDASCTFRLVGVDDPARVEPGVTEVRPAKQ
jgi:hypothetical protein